MDKETTVDELKVLAALVSKIESLDSDARNRAMQFLNAKFPILVKPFGGLPVEEQVQEAIARR